MEDYAYTIEKSRFGTYTSILTSTGERMTTGLTEEACRLVTDTIRIPVMKGTYDGDISVGRKAIVDGKL